ncbi:uncharacterized protein At1g01500-like [Benincasa hispida]|uniref:uncharacterized protein At1g01500-like n=1 Tax=Benincasa hispida TaxID=102211 RepID=UPI0019008ACE|nr:uncharacterized protein At1g01500-like [Benincasa hispida]
MQPAPPHPIARIFWSFRQISCSFRRRSRVSAGFVARSVFVHTSSIFSSDDAQYLRKHLSASNSASIALRRDRLNKESSEVTYVSTDSIQVSGGVKFEVYENEDLILYGSLERIEANWINGSVGLEKNSKKTSWIMECFMAACMCSGSSAFFQPKLGVSSLAIKVYIVGCCFGMPMILTQTIQVSPRQRNLRQGVLDAIPEDEEVGKEENGSNGLIRHQKVQVKCCSPLIILFSIL